MIETTYLKHCLLVLEAAYIKLKNCNPQEIEYDIYRLAVVKEFEIVLEQAGKLLKKCMKPYFHSPKAVNQLTFKDIFREAGKFGILEIDELQRWLDYRDSRNETSHEYGESLANQTLELIEQFLIDSKNLVDKLERFNKHH